MRPFGKKKIRGLATILQDFTEVINDLDALERANNETVETNQSVIQALETKNIQLTAETEKARKVRDKINELIN